ncbi:hypothetical protein PUN28_020368 [Cardiocondyla obscurior]|uniref:Uncharacterized protein n=1 Tax=Cardiocondyla obscurior TaxID=286306 RepID=A0AAW2E9V6_9HYME
MRRNDRVRAHTPPTVACCGVRRIRRRRIREDCRSGRVCRDLESSKRERTPGILWRRRDSRVVRIAEWRVRRFSPLLFLRSRARARSRALKDATSWFSHRADNRRLPLSIIVPAYLVREGTITLNEENRGREIIARLLVLLLHRAHIVALPPPTQRKLERRDFRDIYDEAKIRENLTVL